MDLLDILLARKLSAGDFENSGGAGSPSFPSGGKEGSLLAQGANGPVWIDLEDLPFSTEEETAKFPANNIMGADGSYGLVATEQSLAEVVATKEIGLYTCLVKEENKELQGLCNITSEGSGWAFAFDAEGKCYSQTIVSGIASGWKQIGNEIEEDEEILFNGGNAVR